MAKRLRRSAVLDRLAGIAFGSANDVVKLAFAGDEKSPDMLEGLDMTMLSEIKRSSNGTVEVKLIDRIKVMELLLRELDEPKREGVTGTAEALFTAMDRAARAGGEAE